MSDFTTFPELLLTIQDKPDVTTYLSYLDNKQWKTFSSHEFVSEVNHISEVFYAKGVRKGTTVAIVSDSSPFWLIIDFALQKIGAISVPIFANIAHENLDFELLDSEVEFVYIASQEKYDQIKVSLDAMTLVVTHNIQTSATNTMDYESFRSSVGEAFTSAVLPDDIATIIYTSGSTGQPKGVELTHANFISQIKAVQITVPLPPNPIALSFLPLAHIFERMVMTYYLVNGVTVYFADEVKNVGDLIREIKPSVITVVPRLLDKIYTKMHTGVEEKKGIAKLIGTLAFRRADNKDTLATGLFDGLYKRLVYNKLLQALGGNIELMISGGAPLSPKVERFFSNIGVPLYQGYGLSETSPVISVNSPAQHKFGSCGKALPGVETKLLDDGELLVRGPNVMKGYHKREDKTKETIKDGWLYTGDLASIDSEGYIFVKSRKKELFKTSTGKYVSVIPIEQKITHSKYIDYVVLVADNRPYVSALIFLDPLQSSKTFEEHVNNPAVYEHVNRYIRRLNRHLNHWEQVQKFTLVQTVPTIENHILTPSMKVSREKAYTILANEIEAMYDSTKE